MRKLLAFAVLITIITASGVVSCTLPKQQKSVSAPSRIAATDGTAARSGLITPSLQVTDGIPVRQGQLEGTVITLWYSWSGEKAKTLVDLVTAFNAKNPYHIRVEAQKRGGQFYHDFHSVYGTEDVPDILVDAAIRLPEADRYFPLLTDLRPYLSDSQWGLAENAGQGIIPAFLPTRQDAVIAVPLFRAANVLFYNRTLADELGFSDSPKTPDDFIKQACTAADSADGVQGWVADMKPTTVLSWMYAFGSEVLSPDGSRYRFDSVLGENAFVFLKEMAGKGCWQDEAAEDPLNTFAEHKALFISTSSLAIPAQEKAFESTGIQDEWSVIAYPSGNGEPAVMAA